MAKKSTPILILGILIALLGFFTTLLMLALIPIASFKHISLTALLIDNDLGKEDCLGLILPILALYSVNVTYSLLTWIAGLGIIFGKEWGRKNLIALGVLELLWSAGDVLFAHKAFKRGDGIEVAIILAIITFLSLPRSREVFKKA